MKHQVPFARARVRALERFILDECFTDGGRSSCAEVSDAKGDGTVFVRFRSCTEAPASALARSFREALDGHALAYTRPAELQFRLALDQFSTGSVNLTDHP